MDNQEDNNINNKNSNKNKSKQTTIARKIVVGVVLVIVLLVITVGVIGYRYVNRGLQPLDSKSDEKIEVKVPIGSTTKQIGSILEDKKVIKSGFVFDYYVKTKKYGQFKAGYYELKPSMTLKQISQKLQKGGSSESRYTGKVLVREGVTADSIGDAVEANTRFSKKDFLALLNNQAFVDKLKSTYPELLTSAASAKDVRYKLEGYLYPATYFAGKKVSLEELVTKMVAKTNSVMEPYYTEVKKRNMSVQEVMTLASLVEREGVTEKDRYRIAGVFENRLDKKMMIQSDISVLYALGKHKKNVTYKDLKVDSPYNLYLHQGVGPGPFNNPSLTSIKAVLNPAERDKGYLYFIANMKTGKVYYSKTYEQHQKLTDKLSKENDAK
ncbi:endolytic transglycosylase MltG [Liquorilactobacillus capillatus]|uniref:Endolytic murein transglycosylase n=1 Tax=Liquorilactobacillus capillatus DSM 19910 TaxID=1423731 RepID=A0A0R1M072_9LACO|nr:endolytic transglycosylase MltG [Liquorilactobacillus capillatus]KRL01359.1 aminodeoxychorismate lyase [Liquorilactobacillus capillatus DSM 19910]